jgi:hypothetical protein
MLEYGQGVGQATGVAGGGGAGGSQDLGAAASQFVTNAVDTISTMPPEMLLAMVVVILLGLIMLRRAF